MLVNEIIESRWERFVGMVAILLIGGCAGLGSKPAPPQAARTETTAETMPTQNVSTPPPGGIKRGPDDEVNQTAEPTAETFNPDKRITDIEPENDTVAKSEPPPSALATPSQKARQPAPEIALHKLEKPAAAPLDLPLLEKRLKETAAIGIFTKLALKNQVDDLLEAFRAYYQGRSKTGPAQLRQPYEMLIMKVLALLQDSDPQLAHDLLDSREAIWQFLSDPEKFAAL